MTLKGVLLDVDGTLIDSNDAHAHAWIAALAEAKVVADFGQVRRLIGKGGDKLLPEVSGIDADSELGKSIAERRGEIFKKSYLPWLHPFACVRELLDRMKAAGLKLAVASSAKADELQQLLKVCNAEELAAHSATSDDADHSKPDPDIIHAALKQIGLEAGEVILLGDTPYDVEAGSRAGVKVVGVRCGGWRDADLVGAIRVYDGPAEILAGFEDSPFARGQ